MSGAHEAVLDSLRQQRDVATDLSSMTEAQKDLLNAQIQVYEGLKKTIVGTASSIATIFSTPQAFAGTLLIGFGHVLNKIGDINKSLGQTFDLTDLFDAD